jgi:hypothetical protein
VLVRREGSSFFFQGVVDSLHSHFEVIFSKSDEEDDEGEDTQREERDKETDTGTGGVFQQFGLIPLILSVAKESNNSFDEILSWSVSQTFYIASYIITKNRYEQQQIKQMQMKHR